MIARYTYNPQNAAPTWDEKYRKERLPNASSYSQQPFVQTMLKYLQRGQHVLDAGCGTGGLILLLRDRGLVLTGVDTSATAVEAVRRLAPEVRAEIASIEKLPFPDTSFDAYAAIGAWEYPGKGPEQSAREAWRVLKPGGYAFVEVPLINLFRRLVYLPLKKAELVIQTMRGRAPVFVHHFFARRELASLLSENGFSIVETCPHDLPELSRHYGLWVDWPFLRGGPRYELNAAGRLVERVGNALSPWTISTGMFIVARKHLK